jgi:hypothetical protein
MNKQMKLQLESVVNAIVNEDTAGAKEAFHEYLRAKTQEILLGEASEEDCADEDMEDDKKVDKDLEKDFKDMKKTKKDQEKDDMDDKDDKDDKKSDKKMPAFLKKGDKKDD